MVTLSSLADAKKVAMDDHARARRHSSQGQADEHHSEGFFLPSA
jgi:hypothetical protein